MCFLLLVAEISRVLGLEDAEKEKALCEQGFLVCVNMVWVLLFPLNGSRWFAADIINHAVDAAYFVDDAIGNAAE